jgi:preprotein translocase subunit SecA
MMRARFSQESVMKRQSVARNLSEGHGSSASNADTAPAAIPAGPASAAKSKAPPPGHQPRQTVPTRRDAAKVGRNDPCPCGSGKKYKNCHGR